MLAELWHPQAVKPSPESPEKGEMIFIPFFLLYSQVLDFEKASVSIQLQSIEDLHPGIIPQDLGGGLLPVGGR